MIKIYFIKLLESVIGFSAGLAVGGGYVAFLTLLGIIPRLIQLSKTTHLLKAYIGCIILGSVFGTFLSFSVITWQQPTLFLIILGIFHVYFILLLVAAFYDVIN